MNRWSQRHIWGLLIVSIGRSLAVLLAVLGIGTATLAQRINSFYVDQYDGATVGERVAAAQAACAPDTSLPCVLIFDTILAKVTLGILPAKCAQCTWVDYSGLVTDIGKARYNLVASTAPDGTNFSIKTWEKGGEPNVTSQWGFNLSDTLYAAQNNSEPQMWWGLETNFPNIFVDNHPTMEAYLRFMPIGLTINDPPGTGNYREPFFANFDRITNKIPELNLRGERIRLTPTDQQLDLTFTTLPFLDMSSSGHVFTNGKQYLATLDVNGLTIGLNRVLSNTDVALALNGTTNYGFGWSSGTGPAVYFSGARVATFTPSGMTLPGDPKNPLEAATKQYVDERIPANLATDGLTVGVNRILPTNNDVALALSGTTNYGFGWSPGTGPAVYFNGARVAAFTRSGMTLLDDPKNPLEAATKQYVDKRFPANLATDGLTVGVNRILPANTDVALALNGTTSYGFGWSSGTGPAVYFNGARVATFTPSGITLPSDPKNPLEAATKQYVDQSIPANLATNGLTVGVNKILPTNSDVALALSGTTNYGFGWSSGNGPAVYFNGVRVATFTRSGMTLPGDPKNLLEAATKQYVDKRFTAVAHAGSCATSAIAGSVCTFDVVWPSAFSNLTYIPTCIGQNPTGVPILGLTSLALDKITLYVQAATDVSAGYGTVYCHAVQ